MFPDKYKSLDIPTVTASEIFGDNRGFFIQLSTDYVEYSGKLHKHEFAEISYVISGSAQHEIGGIVYTVRRGDCIAIKRNTPHTFRPVSGNEPFVTYDLMFTEDFFGETYSSGSLGEMCSSLFYPGDEESPDLHLSGYGSFGGIFAHIYTEFHDRKKGYADLIRALTAELIIKMFRKLEAEDGAKLSLRLRAAVNDTAEYLKRNFRNHVTLDELSTRIFFSKDYLNRIFRELMGMPVGSYLQKLRVDEAAKLLRQTDKTVTEISELAGFVDVKSFYTVFKREMNVTPGEYRCAIGQHPSPSERDERSSGGEMV